MSKLDPWPFMHLRVVKASAVQRETHQIAFGGYVMPVAGTNHGGDSVEIWTNSPVGQGNMRMTLRAAMSAPVEVWEFDADSYALENTAAQLAEADGSKWAAIVEESRLFWRKIARAVARPDPRNDAPKPKEPALPKEKR